MLDLEGSSSYSPFRPRFPWKAIALSIGAFLLIASVSIVLVPHLNSRAADAPAGVNMNCTLIVPPNPLTAQGLATPYQLVATDRGQGDCHEANTMQAAFVQAAVIAPNGQISAYSPLVVDKGNQPAVMPVVPQLPAGGIVGIWFGFNGQTLTLQDNSGLCVNGLNGDQFGQFAYCNAPAFFAAANQTIANGQLIVPQIGTANDGMVCPTVRDFSVVDMDQSDNVTTQYLVTNQGQTAQATQANRAQLAQPTVLSNASDNGLLTNFILPALGCTPWKVPDLADTGQMVTALPLDELQASSIQTGMVALVPNGDPMVLVNNKPNMAKLNAYRVGVDQPTVQDAVQSSTLMYCMSLRTVAPARLQRDMPLFMNQASPDPAAATNLFTFLANRFVTTYGNNGLNCQALLNMQNPVTVQMKNNIAVSATINFMGAMPQNNNQQQNKQQKGGQQQNQGDQQNSDGQSQSGQNPSVSSTQ